MIKAAIYKWKYTVIRDLSKNFEKVNPYNSMVKNIETKIKYQYSSFNYCYYHIRIQEVFRSSYIYKLSNWLSNLFWKRTYINLK